MSRLKIRNHLPPQSGCAVRTQQIDKILINDFEMEWATAQHRTIAPSLMEYMIIDTENWWLQGNSGIVSCYTISQIWIFDVYINETTTIIRYHLVGYSTEICFICVNRGVIGRNERSPRTPQIIIFVRNVDFYGRYTSWYAKYFVVSCPPTAWTRPKMPMEFRCYYH